MAQGQSYSYLDLSVHPALSTHVLSSDATVLFSNALDAIYWANAAGAKLFGGKGVVELLDANLTDDHSFVRQLRATIDQIMDEQPIIRGFRIAQGLRSALLQFEIAPIRFADGNLCFKITQRAENESAMRGEHARAVAAVDSLEGFADAAAIVDDYGLPIATTRDFGRLGPSEESLLALTTELKDEADRLIKREIKSASGRAIIAGLGRFAQEPGRNLVVIAKAIEQTTETIETPVIDLVSDQPNSDLVIEADLGAGAIPEASNLLTSAEDETSEKLEPEHNDKILSEFEALEETLADTLDAEETNTGDSETEEDAVALDEHEPIAELEETEATKLVDLEGTEDHRDTEADSDIEPASLSGEEGVDVRDGVELDAEPDDAANGSAQTFEHVRFAWTTDASGIITSVSPELAESIGEQSANIIGRRWSDISTVFGFDSSGEIAQLLAGHDTWSGKTVLWPIEGTDMVAPVDLAALPSFDTDREFQGFRGFGIIRNIDAIVDPEGLGLALKPIPRFKRDEEPELIVSDSEPSPSEETLPTRSNSLLWFETHSDDGDEQEKADDNIKADEVESEPPKTDNVVQFFPSKSASDNAELSPKETAAFKKIGDTLGDTDETKTSASPQRRAPDTSLISKLPIAVLVYRDESLLFVNEKLLEITGYENVESIEDAGGLDALITPSEDDETQDAPSILVCRDGTELPINPVLHSVPWDEEKAFQLSFSPPHIAQSDVGEPAALQITQASEVQAILDTTSDGILLLETSGEIISINASGEALFNVTFDDVTGDHITALFSETSRGPINQYINALSGSGWDGLLQEGREVDASVNAGGEIPVFLAIAKLENSEKLCAVVRDLTSWKKTEAELVKSKRDAERASEQKTDLLAQVSHEIRIPLTAILGFSDIMIEERFGTINNERYRDYLRDIKKSGQHVLDLVNDLLDLSKIEAGKLELSFDAVDLNAIVSEAVAMLQAQANENRIIVRTSLSRAVPKVVADERSVKQVVLNLVNNAIKFSMFNSQVIVSTVYESNGEVALRVRDTGPGMSDEEIEEALKPYHQVKRTQNENYKGTGLGLPLTKALVEANRAYFDLESEPGNGTVVHVQFPVQRVLAD